MDRPPSALLTPVGGGGRSAPSQRLRRSLQLGFFLLFVSAPLLDLLRFDLHETQLWLFGQPWHLGLDAVQHGRASGADAALNLLLKALLPIVLVVGGFLFVAWRYGRLYCGWLCPHFSIVELLNDLLHRAIGKLSLWDRLPVKRAGRRPDGRWWPVFGLACALLGFVWAITLASYLLPPRELWSGLWNGTLTPNQARFIGIGTLVFTAEFAFARHLFCRFGCAVGLFQSLMWMANPRGMVVAFKREQARDCKSCDISPGLSGSACDTACPMRLNPRNIKRMMFSCVQCGQCLDACESSQGRRDKAPLLEWQVGLEAVRETLRQKKLEAQQLASSGERPASRETAAPATNDARPDREAA